MDRVGVYDTLQSSIRSVLASVLGDTHVECKNRNFDAEQEGEEKFSMNFEFNPFFQQQWYKQYLLVKAFVQDK